MAAMFFEICKCPYSFCSTLDRDNVYQISSYSDQRFMRYSFPNLIAPPSGESGNFFYLTKNQCHTHVPEFGEDISFRSRVIAI